LSEGRKDAPSSQPQEAATAAKELRYKAKLARCIQRHPQDERWPQIARAEWLHKIRFVLESSQTDCQYKNMKQLLLFLVALSCAPLVIAVETATNPTTLFVIGETSGQFALFAQKGKPLESPKFIADKTSDPQFLQFATDKDNNTKFYIVTNSGTTEAIMTTVGSAMMFVSVTEYMHSTITVCLDRTFDDGSFLTIETLVRPEAFDAGATTARLFYGRAKQSPFLQAFLAAKKGK